MTGGERRAAPQHGDLHPRQRREQRQRENCRQWQRLRQACLESTGEDRTTDGNDGADVQTRSQRRPVRIGASPSREIESNRRISSDTGDLPARVHLPPSWLRTIESRHGDAHPCVGIGRRSLGSARERRMRSRGNSRSLLSNRGAGVRVEAKTFGWNDFLWFRRLVQIRAHGADRHIDGDRTAVNACRIFR